MSSFIRPTHAFTVFFFFQSFTLFAYAFNSKSVTTVGILRRSHSYVLVHVCSFVRKHLTSWFVNGFRLTEAGPVNFGRCAYRGRPLPVSWRHGVKRLESISHTSDSWNSSKNRVPRIGDRSETAPQLWTTALTNGQRRLDQAHPTQLCDLYVRYAVRVTRRTLTVRGWLRRFLPYSTLANRKWCSRAVPMWRAWLVDGLPLIEVGPVDFGFWKILHFAGGKMILQPK